MADWSANVTPTAGYVSLLALLAARDVDAVTLGKAAYTVPPDGAVEYNRAGSKLREWSTGGGSYTDILIAVAGGGTGAATAANARTNLGLGTMSTQNANAVAITAGAVAADLTGSTNVPAGGLVGGPIAQARLGTGSGGAGTKFLADDQTYKAIVTKTAMQAVKSADFTADVSLGIDVTYPLTGAHTATLPTVVGNGAQRFVFVNRGTGAWTINANAGETILGAASYALAATQYDVLVLIADANNALWDAIVISVHQGSPIGIIDMWGTTVAPTNYVLCDGASLLRAGTYAALFAVIGTTYGSADGTHFNVPDLRQRFPLGKAGSGTGNALGNSGGAIDHAHTSPAHTHTVPALSISASGVLDIVAGASGSTKIGTTSTGDVFSWKRADDIGRAVSSGAASAMDNEAFGAASHSHGGATGTGTSGSTAPADTGTNNPPYLVVNFIIKYQ